MKTPLGTAVGYETTDSFFIFHAEAAESMSLSCDPSLTSLYHTVVFFFKAT